MSDTSRIVDRLIVKGFVKKGTCAADKRLVDVTITEKGQKRHSTSVYVQVNDLFKFLKKLLKKLDGQSNHIEAIMGNLSEKEAEMLSSLLDKLRTG